MSLEDQVAALTLQTINLLNAVNVKKSYLDAAAASAIAGVTAQGAISPTPAKSPLGNAQGVFDAGWIDGNSPTMRSKTLEALGTTDGPSSVLRPATSQGSGVLDLGVIGEGSVSYPGLFRWGTHSGIGSTQKEGYALSLSMYDGGSNSLLERWRFLGTGGLHTGFIHTGSTPPDGLNLLGSNIANPQPGETNFYSPYSLYVFRQGGDFGNNSSATMLINCSLTTGRAINAGGTVNTQGNDYAEYIFKSEGCGDINKGTLVGITSDNQVTLKWDEALLFAIKSTDPSFVGGDVWAKPLGERPKPFKESAPNPPVRKTEVSIVEPSKVDNEEEWNIKLTEYTELQEAYNLRLTQHQSEVQAFEAALEVERQKVDRIAIAGRVPVNVYNASPGDYIIPEQDGEGIKGVAVSDAEITFAQYKRAVGKVISILPDGRAYVMVKVV